jgi:hypothetical protein
MNFEGGSARRLDSHRLIEVIVNEQMPMIG